jgi:hypothetical protein
MEEVISYYGKKLETSEIMKQEIEDLTKRVNVLAQNLNTLGQNYKGLSKNHRNLVDIVRNNLINLRKEKEMEKAKQLNALNQVKPAGPNRVFPNKASSTDALKKKSNDPKSLTNGNLNEKNKLKMELINDLETKYVDLMDDKLTDALLKNLNTNNVNYNKSITTTVTSLTSDSRKLVIRDDGQSGESDLSADSSVQVLNKNRMPTGKSIENFCVYKVLNEFILREMKKCTDQTDGLD